jgi:hypothetical protein
MSEGSKPISLLRLALVLPPLSILAWTAVAAVMGERILLSGLIGLILGVLSLFIILGAYRLQRKP